MGKSVKINTVLNAFRMTLTVIFPLITFPYISRIFLTEGIGKLNYSQSITSIFSLLASLGIYTYGVREGSKVKNNREAFSKLANELLMLNLFSTILTYTVFGFTIFFVRKFYEYRVLLLINGVSIAFSALGLDWIYGVYEEYSYITLRQIICQVITLGLMFLFVRKASDIYIWASIFAASNIGANIFNWLYGRKYFDFSLKSVDFLQVKIHLSPVLILLATRLASTVYSSVDTLLLGSIVNDHSVGLYSAATKVNHILITFFSAMAPVFMPRIVGYLEANNKEKYYLLMRKALSAILMLAIPAIVGIEILAENIITLIAGKPFASASTTMRIIAPVILINTISGIFYYDMFVPVKKEKYVLFCTMFSAILNLVISSILIPSLFENGAAIGSLCAEIITLLIVIMLAFRYDQNIRRSLPNVLLIVLASVLMGAFILLLGLLHQTSTMYLFVSIGGGALVYICSLMLMKYPIIIELLGVIKNKLKR